MPSPLHMPLFETLVGANEEMTNENIMSVICHVFGQDTTISSQIRNNSIISNIDFTGKRIKQCMKIVRIAQQLEKFRQYATCYLNYNDTVNYAHHLPDALKTCNTKRIVMHCHSLQKSLLQSRCAKHFQMAHTQLWNPTLHNAVKLMVPPVMLHDEMQTDGYGMVLIDLLVQLGMLEIKFANSR